MLWLRASCFVLASVPMVLANLTNLSQNVTCVPRIDPKVLSDLKFEDFAMPFGVNTLNNYCRFLKDFYYCDDYLKEKAPLSNKAVQYLITARGYLMNFCDPESYFYQEYKRNEECFAEVLRFYYRCVDSTKDQKVPSFADTWPRDGSVEDCKRESRFVFCMANVMRRVCGKPDPGLYYLLVQKTTHFFEVHCASPQLLDVRRHVGEMMAELFQGKEGLVEKKFEEISRCRSCSSAESDEKCGINKYVFCDHFSPKEKLVTVGMVPNAQELPNICPDALKYFECVSEHSRSCDSTNDPTTKTVNSMLLVVQDICSEDSALYTVYSRHASCYKRLYKTQPGIECEIKAEAVYNSYLLYKSDYGDDIDDSDRTRHRYCMEKSFKTACIATKISEECGSEAHDLFWELIIRSKYLLPICTPEVVKEIQDEFSDYIDEEEMQVKILKGVSEF